MGRGGLHLRIDLAGALWDLVTVHLKSNLLTFPGGRFAPTDENQRARFAAYPLYRRTTEATRWATGPAGDEIHLCDLRKDLGGSPRNRRATRPSPVVNRDKWFCHKFRERVTEPSSVADDNPKPTDEPR